MNLSAFKTYDIRGIYPNEINEELAYAVGRALVRHLSAKTILVGRDMRNSSPSLRKKLIEGLTCEGADVTDIGMCTTPMVTFGVANYNYDAGIMISASHNPGDYNAFKIIKSGPLQIDAESGLLDIKNIVKNGFGQCASKGTTTEKDILSDYLSHILGITNEISNLKISVDYGNGVGAISAKPAFARLDIECHELYPEPNGDFPNHEANPHDTKNFDDLKKKVLKTKSDLGIFFDGDADRALFIDEKGNLVPIDLIVTLLAIRELKNKKGDNVYYDLRFSKAISRHIKEAGGIPIMMKVGNPYYKKALHEKGGLLGAEFSGHVMFAENNNADDGLFVTLKLLELLTNERKPLSDLAESVREYVGSPEESIEAKNPKTVFEKLISEFPKASLVELDGAYLDFPDGFISVRQSQTEPQLFRIRAEAKTPEVLAGRLKKVKEIILS